MKRIIVLISYMLVFLSCENKEKKTRADEIDTMKKDSVKDLNQNTVVAIAVDNESRNWVDDFKDFRQALYTNNKAKLKTYFDFPLYDEGASIWQVCVLTEAERSSREKEVDNADAFYEKDFDRYYKRIFDKKFLSGILKIKSAVLLSKSMTETEEFPDASAPFVMHAYMDEGLKTLQLNMAFRNNGTDGDGNNVSEGEYNIVYVFDIIEGKKIMFKKVVIAG